MNMFKKNGGFTLVELIVVIAILAILATVAVPAYNGYIKRANDAAVETELSAISTAAMAANATAGQLTGITVTNGTTVSITGVAAEKFDEDFEVFYGVESETTSGTASVTITKISAWDASNYKDAGATWTPATGWSFTNNGG